MCLFWTDLCFQGLCEASLWGSKGESRETNEEVAPGRGGEGDGAWDCSGRSAGVENLLDSGPSVKSGFLRDCM